jgi:hypothetical protein
MTKNDQDYIDRKMRSWIYFDYTDLEIDESDYNMISLYKEFMNNNDSTINSELHNMISEMWEDFLEENEMN